MARLAVISDTHLTDDVLPPGLNELLGPVDVVLHCGDFYTLECYNGLNRRFRLKAVHGNSDETELVAMLPKRLTFELGGVRFGAVHKGCSLRGDVDAAAYLAREMGVEVLFVGHWHYPLMESCGEISVLCPGSPTAPKQSDPSAMLVSVEGGKWNAVNVPLGEGQCDSLRAARGFGRKLK